MGDVSAERRFAYGCGKGFVSGWVLGEKGEEGEEYGEIGGDECEGGFEVGPGES